MLSFCSDEAPPWYANEMQNFAVLEPSKLPPNTSKHGYSFTAIAINPLSYLAHLLAQAKAHGVQTKTAELSNLHGFLRDPHSIIPPIDEQPVKLVVNCTGLAAKQFCNDEAMYSIRGQTLLARIQPSPKQEVLLWDGDDEVTYIVPRPGTDTFILGGTKTANAYDAEPTPEISKGIIQRCKKLLGGETEAQFEILAEQVGLRPGRKGGPRVELETVIEDGKRWDVVHNYGHAGGGFQGSIGSARKALELVKQALG
jgi:D-amino-acid oxidase